ncbi:alpha/beta fold hydrolase [Roseicyclus marinus]|uniref:alpha/beta fold hydrolase n=1 Tax=Roseicyclus marinus TaxID=2161673 RepID=UPI00240FFA57|nr:alpha/beta hydrolase [Roseicyclus marinus]MDG3042107.1 alpha/beta hydrolase [Roseicyclus marinus]
MTAYARHWGQGGEPALLLHCSLAHSGAWDGMARALADRLTLTAPDLVGHGRGPAPDPARDYHDQATEAALAHLPDHPTHLIGHSFGATVALRLALDHPDRVASLTLIEPVLFAAARGGPGWAAHVAGMAGVGLRLDAGDAQGATRDFLAQWGGGVPLDAMPKTQQAYMIDRIWVVPASSPALEDDSARLLPRLGQLACPVLLIEGAASPPVIAEIQSGLAAAIPQARRAIIPGAGHMVPITHAGPVAQEIRHLLG